MKDLYTYTIRLVLSIFATALFSVGAMAQIDADYESDGTELASQIVGSGVQISNVSLQCDDDGTGIFTGGNASGLGLANGIVLSSGDVEDIDEGNYEGDTSENLDNQAGDADLDGLVDVPLYDRCILSFDFVPEDEFITVQYVFGSEEYNEFVCSPFNDVFGFFVNGPIPGQNADYDGQNVSLIPTSNLPVAINSVNNGVAGDYDNYDPEDCESLDFDEYFIENPFGADVMYDGLTVVLTAEVAVVPGETYSFKFGIADASDSQWDSGVFIKGSSFSVYQCDAGELSFESEANSPITFCSNDNLDDVVNANTSSIISGDTYKFLLTNNSGEILDINEDGIFNLESYSGDATFKVYGISFDGSVNGIQVGENISDISVNPDDGCFELSEPLIINRETCDEPPFILECPDDLLVSCIEEISANEEGLEFTVECGTNQDASISSSEPELVEGGENCDGSEYRIVYTVTDDCGNSSQCQQIFTIQNDGLSIDNCPDDVTVTSADQIDPQPEDVSYSTSCGVSANVEISGPEVNDLGCNTLAYTYTYTVTDECGNVDTCERTYTLNSGGNISCENSELISIGNDEVGFAGVRYNYPSPGQSTWYYCVEGGSNPALSHISFGLVDECVDGYVDAGTWSNDGDDLTSVGYMEYGTDGSTGFFGLKYDNGFVNEESRKYYFTVEGNFQVDDIQVVAKGGPGFDQGTVPGPSPSCEEVEPEMPPATEITACDEYTWFGETYTESGTYFHFTENEQGCVVKNTLELTINESDEVEISETACDEFTWNDET